MVSEACIHRRNFWSNNREKKNTAILMCQYSLEANSGQTVLSHFPRKKLFFVIDTYLFSNENHGEKMEIQDIWSIE